MEVSGEPVTPVTCAFGSGGLLSTVRSLVGPWSKSEFDGQEKLLSLTVIE
jgi:hypothetical protein